MIKALKHVLLFLLVISLIACQKEEELPELASEVNLKIWGPAAELETISSMLDSFKELYPETQFNIIVEAVEETEIRTSYLQDIDNAADILVASEETLRDLYRISAIQPITYHLKQVTDGNMKTAIDTAKFDGELYAYPYTAEEAYVLFYDKRIYTEEDVQSLEKILEVSRQNGKQFSLDLTDGYYNSSFFIGAGYTFEIQDGKQIIHFNDEKGVQITALMRSIARDETHISLNEESFLQNIGDSVGAGVSGLWNAEVIEAKLQENFGVAKLPTYQLNEENIQLGSFAGFKYFAVSRLSNQAEAAMVLADYLSNQENQILRFEQAKLAPTHLDAQKNEMVKSDIRMLALAAQMPFSVGKNIVSGGYLGAAQSFGLALENSENIESDQDLITRFVREAGGLTEEEFFEEGAEDEDGIDDEGAAEDNGGE